MVQINKVNIPNFDEFAVKNVCSKFVNNKLLLSYFPEFRKIDELIDAIFYDSLSTLYSDYVINMILTVYAMRSGNDAKLED